MGIQEYELKRISLKAQINYLKAYKNDDYYLSLEDQTKTIKEYEDKLDQLIISSIPF